MILELEATDSRESGLIVMPNQAMPWASLVKIYAVMSVVILLIALVFTFKGYVLVLPFAGLDILLLGFALYTSARFGEQKQVIHLEAETIRVEIGTGKPEKQIKFPRYWAKIELQASPHKWLPSRLVLRSHGEEVELGEFLNEQERKGLADLLKRHLQG